jgi:hypothetical protein
LPRSQVPQPASVGVKEYPVYSIVCDTKRQGR